MKFTYTMAQAITLLALIPAWIPSLNGWAFNDPRAIVCWALAVVLILLPVAWDRYGPGIELA